MPGDPTISQLLVEAVGDLRAAQTEHPHYVEKAVAAERFYRQSKATALLQAHGVNIPEREANAERATVIDRSTGELLTLSDVRYARDLAEGLRVSNLEAIKSHRAVVSALQSLAALQRTEADMVRYGPQEAWGET